MEKNENIDIKRIIDIVLSKKLAIILILTLSIVLGYFYSYYYKMPQYSSSVTILLTGDETQGEKGVTQTDLTLNSGLISTYSSIAKSSNVIKKTIDNLGLNISVKELQNDITVTKVENTQFIKITVNSNNPEKAMNIANELASIFSEQIKDIYNLENINIVDAAELENIPFNINHVKDMIIFIALGIFVSTILILIVYIFDDTIKNEKDIQSNLKLESIGVIPNVNKENEELIIETNPKSYVVECLKTIRTNILYSTNITNKKTILITSAKQKEGKSWIVNNIAVAFAQANKNVILIDANLRNVSNINDIFETKQGEGLSDFIKEVSEDKFENLKIANKYIQETKIPNLHILQGGTIPPNASELISSNNMKNLLELLKSMYDIVLLDGAPCMSVSDSIALSSMVDSVILVAENKKTKISDLRKIAKSIEDVNGKIMGAILNKTDLHGKKYYGKGYGYYYGEDTHNSKNEIIKQEIISVDQIVKLAQEKIKIEKNKIAKKEDIQIIKDKQKNEDKKEDLTNEKINDMFVEIEKLKDGQQKNKRELLSNIDHLIENNKQMSENMNKLMDKKNYISEKLENFEEKTIGIESEISKLSDLREQISEINKEIENLKELQNNQISGINIQISNLENSQFNINKELIEKIESININKELIEKIESINFDEKFAEINENILKSKNEYAKMLDERNTPKINQNSNNIISFESLREKRRKKESKLNEKRVFSINQDIMYEEIEGLASYVVELGEETSDIMVN